MLWHGDTKSKMFNWFKSEEEMNDKAVVVPGPQGLPGRTGATGPVGPKGEKGDTSTGDNLDLLKLAFQIEESKNRRKVFYVDVGNLPKAKAEEYVRNVMEKFGQPAHMGDYFLPRREGGRGTEVASLPSADITVEAVLETANKLKNFLNG
jgi:hypothetical protein